MLSPGGSGAVEFVLEEPRPHMGDGHDMPHRHHDKAESSGTRGGMHSPDPQCNLEDAYAAAAAGTLRRQGLLKGEVERLVVLAGCTIAARTDTRTVPPGVTDLVTVGMVVFAKRAE